MSDFEFERADGSKRSVKGYKYAKPKEGTKQYSENRYKEADLPKKVDLRPHLTAVEDQGQTSSCVANAVAGAYEYLAKAHTGEDYDVSRMFIYYNGRYLGADGNEADIEDGGSYIEKAIEGLKKYGACSEKTYPFEAEIVNTTPYKEAYDEAAEFLVEDMALVPTDLYAWKHSLAEGNPIVFGINLYKSFDQQRKKGLVPMPSSKEASRESHGGHSMLAVGYSDKDKLFIVRNSWGEGWGDKGYCYIPYDYLMSPEFNDGDSWIIKQLNNVPINTQEYWDNDDDSIVSDYDSELADMSDDDYQLMLDGMGDYPFEYRLGLLFLYAANADGDLTDAEYAAIAAYLTETNAKLGVTMSAENILRYALKDIENITLIQESVSLFSEYFSTEMLARITSDIESVVSIDGSSVYETSSIYEMIGSWQTESSESSSESYEESSESEESDEEEEEESDEEDEEESDEEDEEESDEEDEEESDEEDEEESDEEEEEESDEEDEEESDEEDEEESDEEDEEESDEEDEE